MRNIVGGKNSCPWHGPDRYLPQCDTCVEPKPVVSDLAALEAQFREKALSMANDAKKYSLLSDDAEAVLALHAEIVEKVKGGA